MNLIFSEQKGRNTKKNIWNRNKSEKEKLTEKVKESDRITHLEESDKWVINNEFNYNT